MKRNKLVLLKGVRAEIMTRNEPRFLFFLLSAVIANSSVLPEFIPMLFHLAF